MMEPERFRLLIWMKLLPLLGLPVPGLFLAISPVSDGWGASTWYALGAIAAIGAAAYAWRTWSRSVVLLDDDGMTLHLPGGVQTWPYEKLLKYRRIGKYRVRMCFDPGRPDAPHLHMHISADFTDAQRFVDALLDHYADAMAHEFTPIEDEAHAPEAA